MKGDKSVFFDEGLIKQMSYIIGDKPRNVTEIIQLQNREPMQPSQEKVIFIVRPELEVIRSLIFQKKGFKAEKEIHIWYVPRRTIECDEELEKNGVSILCDDKCLAL